MFRKLAQDERKKRRSREETHEGSHLPGIKAKAAPRPLPTTLPAVPKQSAGKDAAEEFVIPYDEL